MLMNKHLWPVMALIVVVVAACSKEDPRKTASAPAASAPGSESGGPHFDPVRIARGAQLFGEHCSLCHGPRGQGHPDWQTPSDGSFTAAPPVDGSGNDWKRSRAELAYTIKNGVMRKDGTEVMPRWQGRLDDQDVDDVVTWLQSLWAPEVYDKWLKNQTTASSRP
jgi:mono/diheme cytochrome c family protein